MRRGDILLLYDLVGFHCSFETSEQFALPLIDSVGCQSGHE